MRHQSYAAIHIFLFFAQFSLSVSPNLLDFAHRLAKTWLCRKVMAQSKPT